MKKLVLPCMFLIEVSAVWAQVNVTTFHYDAARTGQNLAEQTLTLGDVNPTDFGRLFSYPVDGFVYAQPLYLSAVSFPDGRFHNVVYVATEHDSVYAFDADGGGQLWKRSFIDPSQGITTLLPQDVGPANTTDLVPEIGITATPTIDAKAGILYVLTKTKEVRGTDNHYVQRIHALDVVTGADTITGPDGKPGQLLADTIFNGGSTYVHDPANPCVPGTGQDSQNGQVCFNGLRQLVRPGLALSDGVLYLASASHGDNTPYHGWVLGYDATTLQLLSAFNTTPNGGLGGIWESADAPAFDDGGNLYVVTGNGTFRREADPARNMYGDSIIKLSTLGGLNVLDSFTPFDQAALNAVDADQGSGGIMLLPDQPGSHPRLLVQTGKRGKIYLLDRDDLGAYREGFGCSLEPIQETCDRAYQFLPNGTIGPSFDTPAYFSDGVNEYLYYGGLGDSLKAFALEFDPDRNGMALVPTPAFRSNVTFGFPGTTPTITANGRDNAIVWAMNINGYGIPARPLPSPTILYAFDALTLGNPIYASNMTGERDQLGNAVKFTTPTVANGKVYIGTQDRLDVFGLFETAVVPPTAPSNLVATSGPPAPAPPAITLAWTNSALNATGVKIERSLDGTSFAPLSTVARHESNYADRTVAASTKYFYRVRATNQVGDSDTSNTASAKTHIAAPVLQVSDIFDHNVSLTWTATADSRYDVARSSDGISFATVGTTPAGTTSFIDGGGVLAFGTYFYRVVAFNTDGDSTTSNTMSATLGPVMVDHSGGFSGANDLTVNGSAKFAGSILKITDGFGQRGTAFTNSQVGIRRFTTSFTYQPRPINGPMADGLTFIIQSRSPMALGLGGGGMGFQTIGNSVAIKLDLFNHGHGGYSTGLYVDGHTPDVPGAGEAVISLVGTPIDLTSGHPFKVTLSYNGSTLTEGIVDMVTGGSVTIDDYAPVDIPSHVDSDAAFVGFGGGTGGFAAVQDIQNWTFSPDESGLPPRRPSNLAVLSVVPAGSNFNVTVGWKANNAYTATGFKLERSTDGTNFSVIASLPIGQTTYTDMNLAAGQYFYRVRSSSSSGDSQPTAPACVPVGGPAVNHGSGFACHGDLTSNGTGTFAGTLARLTDGGGGEAGSIFTNSKVDIRNFTSSFKIQIHTPATATFADGMAFVIQSNSPTALGPNGGGLGYGPDAPGGPRGIRNSIAIKFDVFDNAGEGNNSTGLFSDGRSPTVPESGSGDVLVGLDGSGLDLKSQHVFQVDLTYNGTTLAEKLTDTSTGTSFTTSYAVDIPAKVRGNTAFVGFTGGTGGFTATQDVQTWTFQSQ